MAVADPPVRLRRGALPSPVQGPRWSCDGGIHPLESVQPQTPMCTGGWRRSSLQAVAALDSS